MQSIKEHPNWIWHYDEGSKPQNYGQVNLGDKYVLYAHKTNDSKLAKKCSQLYGFYEVTKKARIRPLAGQDHWVIEGRPFEGTGWVRISRPSQFWIRRKYARSGVSRLEKEEFDGYLSYYRRTGHDEGPIHTGEAKYETTHRRGQDKIRNSALDRYSVQCGLCPIDNQALLIAGHIRGWARGKRERGEPENVILMCAIHDALFGKGFLTLKYDKGSKEYLVVFSKGRLSSKAMRLLRSITSRSLRKPNKHWPSLKHIDWHRENVFLDYRDKDRRLTH